MSESARLADRNLSSLALVDGPRSLRLFATLLGIGVVATLVALVVVPWQQTVTGAGRVVAYDPFDRIQSLAAPVSGRVRTAWVAEGSRVREGDRILEIVDNDPSILRRLQDQRDALLAQMHATEEKIGVLEAQVEALLEAQRLAVEAAGSQVEVAVASVESARHGLEATHASHQQARLNFERQRELARDGLTSALEAEIAERVFKEAQARVKQAQQALEAAQNEERAKRADLGRIRTEAGARVESARASKQSAAVELSSQRERLTALDVRIAQQTTQLITAPRDGTIFRLFASPGAELVRAGDPLVQLIPDTTSRAVELWVDGNDVPLIREQREVRLQFEGWPAVQFSGWPSVAVGTFGGRVALVDPTDDGRGRFRILIVPNVGDEPWPDARTLRQGTRVNGFVLLDRVSLGYELWRQLNGFPPTVAMESSPTSGVPAGEDRG